MVLKVMRLASETSQTKLAKALGISREYEGLIEEGRRRVTEPILTGYCDIYGITRQEYYKMRKMTSFKGTMLYYLTVTDSSKFKKRKPKNDYQLVVKALRIANNMRQLDVAEKLGIIRMNIANFETGRRKPCKKIVAKYTEIFGLNKFEMAYLVHIQKKEQTFQAVLRECLKIAANKQKQ